VELAEHNDNFSDMVAELLKWEERNDIFNLTTRERAEFQQYVNERMEL
jgi:predicted CopG family antitoxin